MQHDLVIFEPPHGHFQFKYPWELYKDLSRLCRHCMYTVTAMDGCLRSEFQCPVHIRELLALPMKRLAQEASRVCLSCPKLLRVLELFFNLIGLLCQELVPYDFPMILHTKSTISFILGACSDGVFEFERKATYVGLLRAKLMLAPLDMPKRVSPSRNQYRMFFVQISAQPPTCTRNLPNMEGLVCKKPILKQKSCRVRR